MGEIAKKKHLHELLESFDMAMLITHAGEKIHARPMVIAEIEGDSAVWFVTSVDAPKADEIRNDARASATFQEGRRFVGLSGTAELSQDRAKIDKLWQESWRAWFPKGKDDPAITLIRLAVEDAEFWDNAGGKGVRYVYEAVKAIVTGQRVGELPDQHGRVRS